VDSGGAAYITGYTESDESTFPASGGPDLTFNGMSDAFVTKVRPDGSGLVYAGYIGGSGDDQGFSIAVDGSGAAYVTGYTESDQATFPVGNGPDLTYNNGGDAFVAEVRSDGGGLVYASYIGGSLQESGEGIAMDSSGAVYITGWTQSDQASFPVVGGPDLTYNGGDYDAFVAKISAPPPPALSINYSAGSPGSYFTITGTNYPPDQNVVVVVNGQVLTDILAADSSGSIVFLLNTSSADPGKYIVTVTDAKALWVDFFLDSADPVRPQEGSGPIFNIPVGIALTKSIYLPLTQR
jgi:hypothetical protein